MRGRRAVHRDKEYDNADLGLLRVNKVISAETTYLFYAKNRFIFNSFDQNIPWDDPPQRQTRWGSLVVCLPLISGHR